MAGRKAHVQNNEAFDQFMQSIPEDARGRGYWRIRMERAGANGGGIMQVICGFLEFQPGETYESLRDRVKRSFADNKGPGVFFAIPCDQEKKEIKNVDKARFEYKESEVPMPEAPTPADVNPIGEAIRTAKRMSADMAALQSMDLQTKVLNKYLGIDKDKKEDESVKETPPPASGLNDMLLWKTLMDDGGTKKKDAVDPALQQQLNDLKMERLVTERIEKAMNEIKTLVQPKEDKTEKLLEKFIEMQSRPKDDSRVEKLLEKFIEAQAAPKDDKIEKLLERVLLKDDEAKRDELRREERRREEEKAAEERRRLDEERKEERRRHEEEIRRREDEKKEEERRREAERREAEKARLEDERRRDDAARVEKSRLEEQARLERERFEKELTEQKRRFDEELKLRRDEIKSEDIRNRQYSSEQQKFQLQLLDIFKNNKDSSLETTSRIVESLTAAGMSSMKTAQDAAETIMEVAKNATPSRKEKEKDDGKGFMDNIKDIAQLAAPFFTPYADADAKIKVLQAASQMSGGALKNAGIPMPGMARPKVRPPMQAAPVGPAPGGYSKADIDSAVEAFTKATGIKPSKAEVEAAMAAFGMSGVEAPMSAAPTAAAPAPTVASAPAGTPTTEASPQASAAGSKGSSYGGMASMIAQYLKAYPILKHALIGNLRDKIGVRSFMPVVTGLNQPALEGLLANVPHQVVMGEIRQVCSDDEVKLIDENETWFAEFRKEMIAILKDSEDEEDEDDAKEAAAKTPEVAKK